MKSRVSRWMVGAAVMIVGLLPLSAAAQEPDPGWVQPRTSWGDPDLQGVWSNETITPFERPADQADREFLTEDEVAAAEGRTAARLERDRLAGPPKTEPPPVGGNVGAYNLVWMDSGTKVVGTRRTSLVVEPPNGRVPLRPETEARRERALERETDSYENMSPWDRCITRGIPGAMFPAGYNNFYRILQMPNHVVIVYEMIHEARIIPLDQRPRLGPEMRFWNGDPRGRWEGATLVVETTGFDDRGWIATSSSQARVKGTPQTSELRVVERFTRVDDQTIDWQVTIEDPEIYTSPWTVAIPLVARPAGRLYEYACHEGNHALSNILRGARVQERGTEESGRERPD